jgi:hypothetical protein
MTLVMDKIEKGDTYMQEVMRIGDEFVMADDDIKDVGHTSADITNAAKKYKTDVLAIIAKGDKHRLVTQHHEHDTELEEDIVKVVMLIYTIANTYEVDVRKVAEAIKYIIDEGE